MIAAICFIFCIKASLLQAYFTSKLIDLNSVGRLNLSDQFHLDSDLAWSDGRSSRYYTGLGMFNGLNEAWLDRTARFYYPEKLSLYTINIHDAYIWVGKPVRISGLNYMQPEEHCQVEPQTRVARNWTVDAKGEWKSEDWKDLLRYLIPLTFFEEKVTSKQLLKSKGPGVWAAYFKDIYLTLDGSVMKDNIEIKRSSSTNFVATFPLTRNKKLLGLIENYNLCSSSMPVLSGNNHEEEIQHIQSRSCAENDLDVFYQNY
ncbi:hypothetical protein DSO57_1022730 [Entomophthora muscae]|uniref:Uncharacterized protein n=1 Tax=Entomophthora muscae TaxID=34485 RepID=A0ACC2S539_9FUNG|nr:hypothetical protein DSO57_1022730 [Entomophthora muscae]